MRITIETVPHELQRYDTVGDWQFAVNGDLDINVSAMSDPRFEFLVGIHELIEAFLCKQQGVSEQSVDDWDKAHLDDIDPGSISGCPYATQHIIASVVERTLARTIGIAWGAYVDEVDKLKK